MTEKLNEQFLNILLSEYEALLCLPVDDAPDWTDIRFLRTGEILSEGFLTALFLGVPDSLNETDTHLWETVRKREVLSGLRGEEECYVLYRPAGKDDKLITFRFAAIPSAEKPESIAVLARNITVTETLRRNLQPDLYDAMGDAERTIMERTAELRDKTLALSFANEEVVELLGNVVESRDTESGQHVQRVKAFTRVLAEQMMADWPEYGLTEETVNTIVSASSLHDTGKIKVPDAILLKPGRLTVEEFAEMKRHCEYGAEILRSAPKGWTPQYTKTAIEIAYSHHEKWDGRGYPQGLSGDEIPLCAQIVSVADCYDALTMARVYKPAFSADKAYSMITGGECGAFSEKVLSSFAKVKETFAGIVTDPARHQEKGGLKLNGRNGLKGLRILLVDDNEMNLEITCDVLSDEGAEVKTASSGNEAVEKFRLDGPFDAVIMDLVMPEMDGLEATRRIRLLEGPRNRVPIIGLSAEGAFNDELHAAGMDAGMAKPLVVGEFTRILITCMKNSSMQMQRQLASTLKIENTDALTKVKSIAAYTDMVATVNNEIKSPDKPEFAIVFIDVDHMKLVNDRMGHDFGDKYLKKCCKVLCDTFKVSPVYRVGGDEFIAVLQGRDYTERERKYAAMKNQVEEYRARKSFDEGRLSFTSGMAVYIPGQDVEMSDVQQRALRALRENSDRR